MKLEQSAVEVGSVWNVVPTGDGGYVVERGRGGNYAEYAGAYGECVEVARRLVAGDCIEDMLDEFGAESAG